ncbi:hypothetical protein F511_27124 [Dorcoceras hygrometricum]|uniref:Uncharacterized protein n=1 Tax=Dorcoceras hygrometricum TaxID=472368 RepID=A0A2Z7B8P2_9LAMI|nr:hypothetical protein F511_27124 [Dorcoceras hygrometricum]
MGSHLLRSTIQKVPIRIRLKNNPELAVIAHYVLVMAGLFCLPMCCSGYLGFSAGHGDGPAGGASEDVLVTNLISLEIRDFNCILGMDVLSSYREIVDFFHGILRFRPQSGEKWDFYGADSRSMIPLVTIMEMFSLVSLENSGFMIYTLRVSQEAFSILLGGDC